MESGEGRRATSGPRAGLSAALDCARGAGDTVAGHGHHGRHASPSRRQFLTALAAGSVALPVLAGCGSRRNAWDGGDPALLDIVTAGRALRARRLSPVELVDAHLRRIERFDDELRSYVTVLAEPALAEARAAEHEMRAGRWRGRLHGIPIGIKDNIDVAGVPTTAASHALRDRHPDTDAPSVRRLRDAGAIILGKLNLHEFAIGSTSVVSATGAVRNPWSLDHVAGGSSGGSAAAVAAALCAGAVGTDTGGSIRIPASCCGIVGLKPTFAAVDAAGVVYVSTSFDHVGPMARTVADTALMFEAMAHERAAAPFDVESPPPVSALRIGVLDLDEKLLCDVPIESEVGAAFDEALEVLAGLVASVRPARPPIRDHGAVVDLEAFLEHDARFTREAAHYQPATRSGLEKDRGTLTIEEVNRRLPDARAALARYRAEATSWFTDVDLLVSPTLPTLPIRTAEAQDPFALKACTFAFNEAGLPSISVPCGFSAEGLPIGLLISGPPHAEARVLALALAYERATDWHERRPPVFGNAVTGL